MLVDERFDMPLIARLRPAALVVAAGRLVELVDELLEPAGAQDVDGSALTADDRDQRSVAAADERDERREVELAANGDLVGHRIAQRQCPPCVVEPGAEDGDAARAVSVEVALKEVANPDEIGSESLALLVGQLVG